MKIPLLKTWCVIGLLIFSVKPLLAQNSVFFNHYMLNPSYFNPAWGGGEKKGFVALQYRNQWTGYSTSYDGSGGAPTSSMLSAIIPVQGSRFSSFGMNVIQDQQGVVTNFQVAIPISYTIPLSRSSVSIGLAPGVFMQRVDADQYRANNPDDPLVQGLAGSGSQMSPNLGAGIYYRNEKGFFVGVGVENIFQPGIDYGVSGLNNSQVRVYDLHAGHAWKISDDFSISPTVIVSTDLNNFTFNLGAIAKIKDKIWTGLAYRNSESGTVYLGYSMLKDNQLKAGYSFEYVFFNQGAKSITTNELFIRYDLPNLVFGGRKRVKTPRFTF